MIKKIFIFTLIMISVFNLTPWSSCRVLKNDFHFSVYQIALQLDNAIHNDINIPFFIIRLFHNKIIFYIFDIFKHYLLLFDVNFLINLISITGIAGIVLGIFCFLLDKKKRVYLWVTTAVVLTINFIEIIINPNILFQLKLTIMSVPYYFLSFFGYNFLFKKYKNRWVLFVVLIFIWLTVWWQIVFLKKEIFSFCI